MLTENQEKAKAILTMLNDGGMGTLAHEIQEIIREAWHEGFGAAEINGPIYSVTVLNPYLRLGL